jgi:hypothetical protein
MTNIKSKDREMFEYQEKMGTLGETPLDKLNRFIDWEIFRSILNEVLVPKFQKGPGGDCHYDYVFMFKILILQRYYNLSDGQTEFRISGSLPLQRLFGITLSDKVPEQNKMCDFRERLTKGYLCSMDKDKR